MPIWDILINKTVRTAREKKAQEAVRENAKQFYQMRKDAGLSREQLALMLYKDESKEQRIGRIERGDIQPNFREGFMWLKYCASAVSASAEETVDDCMKRLDYNNLKRESE